MTKPRFYPNLALNLNHNLTLTNLGDKLFEDMFYTPKMYIHKCH